MLTQRKRCGFWLLVCASLLADSAMAQGEDSDVQPAGLVESLTAGRPGLMLRYRHEFVDQQSFDDDANASTLLLRLNYATGRWKGWRGVVEFDEVLEALFEDFNSGAGTSSPQRNRFPVVADPNGADLNELYLEYAPNDDWRARFGRQRINLDDQRYVGGVGWRQNEQTYDGVSFQYTGIDRADVFYTYVGNVNRIFGERVDAGDHKHQTHLLNGRYSVNKDWTIVGYAYLIDTDDAPTFSTDTFGLRASGKTGIGGETFDLLAEYALQSDAGSAPASFDTDYLRLQAIWSNSTWSAGAGIELLGSDNNQGFRTPLATLHAFNGWADLFLATPGAGLEDVYLRVGVKPKDWNVLLTYHDFSADVGGESYGSEIDLSASRRFGERYDLLLKFASFDTDSPAFPDTTKFWLMVTARF